MPYRTRCRFWRDSMEEAEIRWVEARPNALVMDTESIIVNSFQEADKELWSGVGEVWGKARPYTGQRAPAGLTGDHVCGTPEDFAQGGHYDTGPPEVRYGATGFSLCCDPPKLPRGGAGGGGRAGVDVRPALVLSGGAGAGGLAHPVVEGPAVPACACADAPTLAVGVLYVMSAPCDVLNFVRFAVDNGTLYRVTLTMDAGFVEAQVSLGVDCGSLSIEFTRSPPSGFGFVTSTADDQFVYVNFAGPTPAPLPCSVIVEVV